MNWALFEQLDRVRRLQGMALDFVGLGPIETTYRVVHNESGVRLRSYGSTSARGPLVFIVPAPIKRPYIWDLAPEASVVRACLAAGARVFLIDWQPAACQYGLADYAERLILDCVEAAGDEPVFLLSHSLGGLFTAIFSALHPERVRGLVLISSPLHFGAHAGLLGAIADGLDLDSLPESIPGSFLSMASLRASPQTFGGDRWTDAVASLADPAALRNHLRVERWTLDEFPLPRALVAQLATLLLREDRLVRGTLQIDSRSVLPSQLAAPLLCVVDPRCRLVPPEAVRPFYEPAGSRDKTWLHYEGDVGVSLQHVGPLVGRRAHAILWPEILRWIERH